MKIVSLAILFALSTVVTVQADEYGDAVRMKQLETAIRLQTLTTQALRKGDYTLACNAQNVATQAIKQAGIKDVNNLSELEYFEICTVSTIFDGEFQSTQYIGN
jgi:hypothetical protein|tara:strand:- start:47 stop:358 length:312 start_codon:yes stop_codon:yes gene_type:complete